VGLILRETNLLVTSSGLPDLLAPPDVPHTVPVQALPQDAPHIQAADRLLGDGHSSDRVRAHAVRPHVTHLPRSGPLAHHGRPDDVHLLPRHHRSLGHQLQGLLVAAVAAALHLSRQPPPVLPRQFRIQHRILGSCQYPVTFSFFVGSGKIT
jgi:hypothetical protein